METTVKNFAKEIIMNATKLEMVTPEPTSNRFKLRTFIWCVDSIPENYVVEEINRLYFVNDRHGYFKSNKKNIVNLSKSIDDWDTGITDYLQEREINMGAVGSRLLVNDDGDIVVYKVKGFVSGNGSSDIYFDVK